MNTKWINMVVLAIACILGTSAARAHEFRWISGGWDYPNSWERYTFIETEGPCDGTPPCGYWAWVAQDDGGFVPGCGDSATIQSGQQMTIHSGVTISISQLTVDGSLIIGSFGCLKLCGSNASLTVSLAEGVTLTSSTASIWVSTDATFSGTGSIRGLASFADIAIGPISGSTIVTLTNSTTIKGELIISDYNDSGINAVLDNQGTIEAYGGTITIDSSLYAITDAAGGCTHPSWKVTAPILGATLIMNQGSTGLSGSFFVDTYGTLILNANITTSGYLKNLGSIVGAAAANFTYAGTCP